MNRHPLSQVRYDLSIIAGWITPGSKVLDLGCGQGELLEYLLAFKNVRGFGVEQDEDKAAEGIARGVSILQGDLIREITDYPDGFFDFVVLSQTLQQVPTPLELIMEMLRVGKRGIVSFPNFAHWRNRCQLFFQGQAPVTPELPFDWHDTPNIRVVTLKDFTRFCLKNAVTIEDAVAIKRSLTQTTGLVVKRLPNLMATHGIFLIRGDGE